MGSNPSKQRPGFRPPPPPPRGIIRGQGPRQPMPGYPGTYGNIQEQLFTTDNFAPAPRNPHTVNFRDQLVTPSEASGAVHPAPRPPQANEQQDKPLPNDANKPEPESRVDVLSPPSPMRHQVNRPPRDWENLRMISHAPPQYRARYPYQQPVVRYARYPVWQRNATHQVPRRMAPRAIPVHRRHPPPPPPPPPPPAPAYYPRPPPRPAYAVTEYYEPERPRPGPSTHGYKDAYIPSPQPPGQKQDLIPEPANGSPQQPVPKAAPEPSRVVRQDQKPVLVQPLQLTQAAAPRPVQTYVHEVTVPVVNGENYEVESLLSQPKPVVEDEREEKYLSPREIDLLSRSDLSKKDDDDDYIGANLRFYRNEIRFRPNGEYIDHIHKYWYRDYQKLANNSTYIPWLFPLPSQSRVNPLTEPLKQHEARHIGKDMEARERFLTSYRMMLDFFGLELVSEKTGQVKRAPNWKQRFYHLKRSKRSHERITRILTSLGQLGFGHLQAPLVLFLLHETLETRELSGIPFHALKDWHRSIDDDFDANYVVDQFDRIHKKPTNNHLTKRKPAKQGHVTNRSNEPRKPEIAETAAPRNEDLFYHFEPANRKAEIEQGGSHRNKEKRLTYRDEAVTYTKPKAAVNDSNNNEIISPGADDGGAVASPRNDQPTPTAGTSNENASQQQANASPTPVVYDSQPPAYSEHDPY